MGFFDKLVFWKKKDELESLGQQNYPLPPGGDQWSQPQQSWSQPGLGQPYQQPAYQQAFPQQPFPSPYSQPMDSMQGSAAYTQGRQLELVSAKLEAIKAALDALNQRMANVERQLETQDVYRKRGW